MNGTMVACLSCKNVVWAYDANLGDVRGILNMMKLPCRVCGARGNYDGWRIDHKTIADWDCPDAWSAMHELAKQEGFGWQNSPDCTWDIYPKEAAQV